MLKNYIKKLGLGFMVVILMFGNIVFAAGPDYGAAGALQKESFSIERMLTYALQDEYLAKAEYEAVIETYGKIRPFTNIVLSEEQHVSLLKPLFEKYDIKLPEDNSSKYIFVPDNLTDTFKLEVKTEVNNIAMYEKFLDQKDLPEDIKLVFEALKNASENHLKAFERGVSRNR